MQTSHEMEKGRYHSSPNPYDKGALANIRESLLEKLPPPRVDFRAAAEPTWGPAGGESEGDLPTPSDDAGGQAMRDARC
jgi:palmitoyltransferase ZDHHC9/14/18